MMTGDGYLWKTNKRTLQLLEALQHAREICYMSLEVEDGKNGPEIVAVLRNIRSTEDAIAEIAKEDSNSDDKDRGNTEEEVD